MKRTKLSDDLLDVVDEAADQFVAMQPDPMKELRELADTLMFSVGLRGLAVKEKKAIRDRHPDWFE
jgi:hypothetical protein